MATIPKKLKKLVQPLLALLPTIPYLYFTTSSQQDLIQNLQFITIYTIGYNILTQLQKKITQKRKIKHKKITQLALPILLILTLTALQDTPPISHYIPANFYYTTLPTMMYTSAISTWIPKKILGIKRRKN